MTITTLLLLATDAAPPEILDPGSRWTITAVVGIAFLILLRQTIPAMCKTFAASGDKKDALFATALETQAASFAAAIREIADRQHDDSAKMNETLNRMTANCAAVMAASKTIP